MATDPSPKKITKDDIERQLAGFQQTLQGKVDDRRQTLISAGVVVAVLVVLVVFFLGKRTGKRSSTFLEIRRL
jgi:ABC-type glycerol-3-phosphate transport system permease component